MREPDPRKRRQKALRLLLTRGYSSAAAWQAIGEVLDDHSKDR
jgi:SOS response regulatory protein OraA/RecX